MSSIVASGSLGLNSDGRIFPLVGSPSMSSVTHRLNAVLIVPSPVLRTIRLTSHSTSTVLAG